MQESVWINIEVHRNLRFVHHAQFSEGTSLGEKTREEETREEKKRQIRADGNAIGFFLLIHHSGSK